MPSSIYRATGEIYKSYSGTNAYVTFITPKAGIRPE